MSARERTQESRILWLLQAAWPNWTPAPEFARISLQYNARIFSLRRKKGWEIENKVEVCDGVKHGHFRLATPGTFPTPKPQSSPTNLKNKNTEAPQPMAQSGQSHAATVEQWDCDPWLLNAPTGTIDLPNPKPKKTDSQNKALSTPELLFDLPERIHPYPD